MIQDLDSRSRMDLKSRILDLVFCILDPGSGIPGIPREINGHESLDGNCVSHDILFAFSSNIARRALETSALDYMSTTHPPVRRTQLSRLWCVLYTACG